MPGAVLGLYMLSHEFYIQGRFFCFFSDEETD